MKIIAPAKCCFCVPLRKGLLCIGYIRLIISLIVLSRYTRLCVAISEHTQDSNELLDFLQCVSSTIPQLLDFIFTLMFIVAAHKKTLKLFELYYFYSKVILFVYVFVVFMNICDSDRFNMLYFVMFQFDMLAIDMSYYEMIICGTIAIVIQAYLTLLVRSEVLKLKERSRAELSKQNTC